MFQHNTDEAEADNFQRGWQAKALIWLNEYVISFFFSTCYDTVLRSL